MDRWGDRLPEASPCAVADVAALRGALRPDGLDQLRGVGSTSEGVMSCEHHVAMAGSLPNVHVDIGSVYVRTLRLGYSDADAEGWTVVIERGERRVVFWGVPRETLASHQPRGDAADPRTEPAAVHDA